ncbi:MAG: ClbS/DfsB family four-helix bundle protein [Cohaesibacter sp.]|jgi:hypothetical protein|nr:ClbS/DfsB family four-helix bundle protein [Cohaesibacter sp.]
MPAATNKADLIAVTLKDFDRLSALLGDLTPELVHWQPEEEDGISIKDLIAHRTHWLGLFFVWYEGGLAGKEVATPAPGYKWNQLKAYNAMIREQMQPLGWEQILADFKKAHLKLLDFLQKSEDEHLYTKKLYPWMNNWTLGRWAEASGASHYRSAAKYIRKIKRDYKKLQD